VYPFLLQVGDPYLWIHSYPTMIAVAVVVCFLLGPRWACALEGISPSTTRRCMVLIGLATFAGGHLHYLVNAWRFVLFRTSTGDIGLLLWSGIHAPGAILGLVLGACLAVRRYRIPLTKFGDALAPTIGVGIAIGRLGCFLNGCCYGTPCTWPWCVVFPEGSSAWNQHRFLGLIALDATRSAPVHPLQLYFAASGLLITAVAFWLQPRKRYDGQVALVSLLIFSLTSLALEPLRAPFGLRAYWGRLPQLTWVLLGMTAVILLVLLIAEVRHARRNRMRLPLPA
jgi:phosphatidylglycerol:prolipoprotein diacylglycerol transferase